MAYYNYKRVMYRDDYSDALEKWQKEHPHEEYEGTCDYDGDGWVIVEYLLNLKDARIKELELQVERGK